MKLVLTRARVAILANMTPDAISVAVHRKRLVEDHVVLGIVNPVVKKGITWQSVVSYLGLSPQTQDRVLMQSRLFGVNEGLTLEKLEAGEIEVMWGVEGVDDARRGGAHGPGVESCHMNTSSEFAVLKDCVKKAVSERQSRVPDDVKFYADEDEGDLHVFWESKAPTLAGAYVMSLKEDRDRFCIEYKTTGDLPTPWRMTRQLSPHGQYQMGTARWLLEPLFSRESLSEW